MRSSIPLWRACARQRIIRQRVPLPSGGRSDYSDKLLALDSAGLPWIAWEELDSTGKNIFLRHWNGSVWVGVGGSESGLGLSGGGGSNQAPSLVLDSSNNPVAAWTYSYYGIYVRHWDGTAWIPYGTSDTGSGLTDGTGSNFNAQVRLDASNRPVVAWAHSFPSIGSDPPLPPQIYLKRWNGTAWEELAGSASGNGISNAAYNTESPSLVLDAAGNPIVAWTHTDVPGQGSFMLVKTWNGTAWVGYGGSGQVPGISGAGGSGQAPSIAIDSGGNPMVAWNEYGLSAAPYGEIYLRRWDGTAWSELGGSATGAGISAAGNGARYASLRLGPSNQPVVAWGNGPLYATDEIFVKTWNGTAWVEIAGSATGGGVSNTPTVSSTFPSLALTAAGDPAVAWSEDYIGSAPRIYFRQILAAPVPTLTVAAMTPAPGSVVKKHPSVLTVTLSAPPDPTTVNGVSVTLVRAGKDKKLGTPDDVEIHTTVSVTGAVIQVDLCRQPLPSGAYRLRVKGTAGTGPGSAVRSVSGHLLDGEFSGSFPSGNGTDGGDFVADFSLK